MLPAFADALASRPQLLNDILQGIFIYSYGRRAKTRIFGLVFQISRLTA